MIGRNIQRVEIVELGLDLRPVQHTESERTKQVFDLPLNLRDRMQASRPHAGRGNGEIEPFGIQPFRQSRPLELGFAALVRALHRLLRGVDELAALRTLGRRELAHVFAEFGEFALASQHFDADGLELFGGLRGMDRSDGAADEVFHPLRPYAAGR